MGEDNERNRTPPIIESLNSYATFPAISLFLKRLEMISISDLEGGDAVSVGNLSILSPISKDGIYPITKIQILLTLVY